MKTVERTDKTEVTVAAPPAKAHTLRSLFLAGMAQGESVIRNPLLADDQLRAIDCLRKLGVEIVQDEDIIRINGAGSENGVAFKPQAEELNVGESGVTMNFMTAIACLSPSPVTITGAPGLIVRPVSEIVDGLRQLGCKIDYLDKEGFPPLKVHGGGIPGGEARIRGDKMSQYFSAIVAAAPCADNAVHLTCVGEMTEKPYLSITTSMMEVFGVSIDQNGFETFSVATDAAYKAVDYAVEGDFSSASFFFGAAAVCGNTVTVTGLNPDSLQGDKRFVSLLEDMGCGVTTSKDSVTVQGKPMTSVTVDMSDIPDLVPPLAVVAAFAQGRTRFTDIGHLRHKECDRLAACVSELRKMGVDASCDSTSLTVSGGIKPCGARIDPHNDHRIAMSFAVAGLATGGQGIENEMCVAKSFPDFWDRLQAFH